MSWYIITTPRHQEKQVKNVLDKYVLAPIEGGKKHRFNTFLPLKKEGVTMGETQRPLEALEPFFAGLVFVQSTKPLLEQWVNEAGLGCRFYTDVNGDPIIVPDYQIRLFKDYLSFVNSEVMVLRKPYSYFLKKKRIRILNGPFAGLEGRLFQIKGNYKLVYGLENTALALSDIAKYTYVEVTNEPSSQLSYTYYYNQVKTDLLTMTEEQATHEEILRRLQHWRQEASILMMENPLASCYISLVLQQTLADLYDKQSLCFKHEETLRSLKSLYLDTEDYLCVALTKMEDSTLITHLRERSEQLRHRPLYDKDPLGFRQIDETNPQDYAFIRQQESEYVKVVEFLPTDKEQAFAHLVAILDEIADKLQQPQYINHLDSIANYRLRKLLRSVSRLYRKCREGQSADFQVFTQKTLRRLLHRPSYQPGGFFDLLQSIRRGHEHRSTDTP